MSEVLYGGFNNYGFINAEVPKNVMEAIKKETLEFPEQSVNHMLAGNIKHEYALKDSFSLVEEFVTNLCYDYQNTWDPKYTNQNLDKENWRLSQLWVNYQKKYEFNPPHIHDGSFSFVIFVKIPYAMIDEINYSSVKGSNMPRAGVFQFIFTNIFGEVREAAQPVDREYEGRIFLFPSVLTHQVFPFYTSDEYRITVSGNINGDKI
jgi:hypothetical protein